MHISAYIFSERDGDDVRIDIEAKFTPATDDVPYLSNGEPGHPGDPEEVEILEASIDGEPTALSEDEEERAILAVIESATD
jgi:hypothetical protein